MTTTTKKSNLEKLQSLCDTVNRRYSSGLNDDDQINRLFTFESKIDDAKVIIGFDKYRALSVIELKKLKKENEVQKYPNGKEFFEFNIVKNGMYLGRYKCNLPI